jgi:hypothetical protein
MKLQHFVLCVIIISRFAFTQLGDQEMIYWLLLRKVTFLVAHKRLWRLVNYRLPFESEKLPQVTSLCRSGYSEILLSVICVLGGVRQERRLHLGSPALSVRLKGCAGRKFWLNTSKTGNVNTTWHWDAFTTPLLPWKSNNCYIFWMCERALSCACVRVWVHACVWEGVREGVLRACAHVAILSSAACRSTSFFGIIS